MKKVYRILTILGLLSLLVVFSSCSRYASSDSLNNISLMMTKQDAIQKMKAKGIVRGAIVNKFGQNIEVVEYQIDQGKSGKQLGAELTVTLLTVGLASPILLSEGKISTYWLYFCDGKLVQWGKAGDWTEAQKIIYDINFKIS